MLAYEAIDAQAGREGRRLKQVRARAAGQAGGVGEGNDEQRRDRRDRERPAQPVASARAPMTAGPTRNATHARRERDIADPGALVEPGARPAATNKPRDNTQQRRRP